MTKKQRKQPDFGVAQKEQGDSKAAPITIPPRGNNKDRLHTRSKVLNRVALFGDSGIALVFSFALLLVAIAVSFFINEEGGGISRADRTIAIKVDVENDDQYYEELYQKLGPAPNIDPPRVYSIQDDDDGSIIKAIYQAYQKDGVVAVRGLIPDNLLQRLDVESRQLIETELERKQSPKRNKKSVTADGGNNKPKQSTQFHTMYHSPMFLEPPVLGDNGDITINDYGARSHNVKNATAFLETALLSQVPIMASKLMLPELQEGEPVRVMRDIFLAKDEEEFICGFHVDDFGFWPATASAPGINAWIALDDMPAAGGGGFALAVGSHEASWRDEAHFVTGATTTVPPQGYQSAADMFANRTGSGTCNIQTSAPHLYRRMEETKRIYELQKGDVIFHQRWLFHRTVAFERSYVAEMKNNNLLYRRYSIRFSPGSAVIPPGYGTELSVLWDERNGNRTADQVSRLDGPWYPKVWPSASATELRDIKDLISNKIPVAQERKLARQKEMQPFLKKAAKEAANKQRRSNRI